MALILGINALTGEKVKRRISLENLSAFSGCMATCLAAGLTLPKSLRSCGGQSPCGMLREAATAAVEQTEGGLTLADALDGAGGHLPAFFLPVVRCGEQSGRLVEAFKYLEHHCNQLARPTRLFWKTWFYPLTVILFGWVVKVAAYLVFASVYEALAYVGRTLVSCVPTAAIVLVVLAVPQARAAIRQATLYLPLIGPAQRDLSINRFFHVLCLLYSTGGMRVEAMIRSAAQTVAVASIRREFLRAAEIVERGGSFFDAFAASTVLKLELKQFIAVGEESGKMEEAFASIIRITAESASSMLDRFNRIFFRLLVFLVTISVATTLISLATRFAVR